MTILLLGAMRPLHGSIVPGGIVHSQHKRHLGLNKAPGEPGRPTRSDKRLPGANERSEEAKMAYVSASRRETVSIGDRIVALFKVMNQAMQRRLVYVQTLEELNALGDRDLADLGIERNDLRTVARQAAYGV